jgi:hypothetical protein
MERYLKDLPIPVYIHLYPQSPNFVPERLDGEYARQVQLERQVVPFAQVWQDLRSNFGLDTPQLPLFPPATTVSVEIDEEKIIFKLSLSQTKVVYRQDLEDLWNTLRLHGTVSLDDIPEPIRITEAAKLVFNLLSQLPYIRQINLQPLKSRTPIEGLQFSPPAQIIPTIEVEMVV